MVIEIANWLMIRLVTRLEQKVGRGLNRGTGSLASLVFQRYHDHIVMLEARLIDASRLDLDRYGYLYFDSVIRLGPLSAEEAMLWQQLLQQERQEVEQKLRQATLAEDIDNLSWESVEINRIFHLVQLIPSPTASLS